MYFFEWWKFCLLGIVNGQYPLEEPSGAMAGPLSQMSEAVNNIDRGSNVDMFQNKVRRLQQDKLAEMTNGDLAELLIKLCTYQSGHCLIS